MYVLGLMVSTAIVFTTVGDNLDKDRFLGPNVLKKPVLCITPLLPMLVLKTAEDGKNHKELVSSLCF